MILDFISKIAVFNRQDWKLSLSNLEIHLRSKALLCGFPINQKLMEAISLMQNIESLIIESEGLVSLISPLSTAH